MRFYSDSWTLSRLTPRILCTIFSQLLRGGEPIAITSFLYKAHFRTKLCELPRNIVYSPLYSQNSNKLKTQQPDLNPKD